MQDLLEQSSFDKLKEGSVVSGTITEIRQNEVVVDIGGKSEGLIPAHEFIDIGELQIGSQIEVLLEKLEDKTGNPVVSFDKAEQKKNWENILTTFPEGSVATGRVKAKVKGGLIISVGVDAFMPASHIDVQPPKNLDQYVGQTYDFKVLKINPERKNIVLSRRELIEEQRAEKRRTLLDSIEPGQVRKGIVKNITDFGAFIDLDGMDGLLHITDMSWGRISHPSEMLKQGEEIEVMIIEVNRDKERVSLGLKQTTKNPWDEIDRKYPVGAKIAGKVVNLVPYGAFVELEPGVEGLVHITEMSWTKRISKPSELLKVGDEVEAVVLGIQKDEQKISLGLRQLEPNPWDMVRHNYPVGARVRGKVRNMTTYGAFIELEEGIDGMVHVSDMSWTRKVNHPSEVLKKGDEVEATVLDVDAQQQRISLGMKQLSDDPWSDIDSHFKIGDVITGTVTKLTSFGAFVDLKDGIDGLVHISQISEDRVEKVKDVLSAGQEVTARVIKIDREERRLGLSIKAANYSSEELAAETASFEALNRQSGTDMMNLGDILDAAHDKKD
ncbi:30S ribosomal protein S1 [Cephaloticoccus capnophilus]|uniref:30S ribosomal protein S1 n=2 Tax=Cephaloticoccus capnophilus TaxID=1548208 RepID=A0A139SJL0_9BACT|nr:30S ribosomal protein S1 [Cephaloticoccus capnophilus]